jgi:large repetitive protein
MGYDCRAEVGWGAADATTLGVVASANPPVTGQGVVYTAIVAPVGPGAGIPSGTVTFTVTGPKKPPVSCTATYSVAVTYSGSTQFLASSGSLAQTIGQGAAMVSVTSSANPSVSGAAVTFNASVAPTSPAGGKVTGTVTWTITGADNSVVTCNNADTVNVSGGNAKCAVRKGVLSAASGPYVVAASYSGSTSFTPAFGSIGQTLTKATTKTKLQSSANKTSPGQSVTFTATVTSSGTGSMASNGNGDFVATCTVATGVLTFANSPYQVVATYSGDASDLSSGDTTSHSVSKR